MCDKFLFLFSRFIKITLGKESTILYLLMCLWQNRSFMPKHIVNITKGRHTLSAVRTVSASDAVNVENQIAVTVSSLLDIT